MWFFIRLVYRVPVVSQNFFILFIFDGIPVALCFYLPLVLAGLLK